MCNSIQGEYVGNSVQFSIFKFKRNHLLWEFGDQMFNGEFIEGWAIMEKCQLVWFVEKWGETADKRKAILEGNWRQQ